VTALRDRYAPPPATEASIAALVVAWLRDQRFEVYQEVHVHGRTCDIVATRGPLLWAIETKMQYGVAVLDQADYWRGRANLVSVATPPSMRCSPVLDYFADQHGIGRLTVDQYEIVRERCHPRFDRKVAASLRNHLREEQKTLVAAGTNRGGYFTPFKETCMQVARMVRQQPGITLGELLADGHFHYASKASARTGIAKWAEEGAIEGVRVEREGRAIRLYPEDVGPAQRSLLGGAA
jgi:hypothetical protein